MSSLSSGAAHLHHSIIPPEGGTLSPSETYQCQSHDCNISEGLPARPYYENYTFDFLKLMKMCNVKLNSILILHLSKGAELDI